MSQDKEIVRRLSLGESQRRIAAELHVSRNTIRRICSVLEQQHMELEPLLGKSEAEVHQLFFPPEADAPAALLTDCQRIHKELLRKGVTLKLLWEEYADRCTDGNLPHLSYSQFCRQYHAFVEERNLTMHIRHKPADRIMVDWAGGVLRIGNPDAGQRSKAYLFVAVLPFSMYGYAEAMPDMKLASWIRAHIHAFRFFGGVARLLICDNLKTGVIRHRNSEDPLLNPVYKEMAEHYGTALLPARVLAPKDKAAAESTVGSLTTTISARLRDRTFLTLRDLNAAVWKELQKFNEAPFQKRDGSRLSAFQEEEAPFLKPLPAVEYECAEWQKATVGIDYHVCVAHQYYSVPYQYVHKKVDARLTSAAVEILYDGERIAMHPRLIGRRHQYSTFPEHMPKEHQLYALWDGPRFLRWAKQVGPSAHEVIRQRLQSYPVEEQAYRICIALLKLAETYTTERLEHACALALQKDTEPGYNLIHGILKQKLDIEAEANAPKDDGHAFLRGAAYYGGEHHGE